MSEPAPVRNPADHQPASEQDAFEAEDDSKEPAADFQKFQRQSIRSRCRARGPRHDA